MQNWADAEILRCRNTEIVEYLDSERVTFAMTVRDWNKLSMIELDLLGGMGEREKGIVSWSN